MQATHHRPHFDYYVADRVVLAKNTLRHAQQVLRVVYTAIPLVAGIDKFANVLVNWERYLSPAVVRRAPMPIHYLMYWIGLVEVVAALLVALVPRVGGYVVGLWLLAVVGNLVSIGGYYDIVLRDLGLAFGAFALAQLSGALKHL
jgi:hypothetical protein